MYSKKRKICTLYASDEHLAIILISYIYEKTEGEKNTITIFEKDLAETIQKIFKNENKNQIDWHKTENSKLGEKLKGKLKGKNIVVVGGLTYINKVNALLENLEEDFTIINCFNILSKENKIKQILEEHTEILTTQGIEYIRKNLIKA